jgi:hypothetical protein
MKNKLFLCGLATAFVFMQSCQKNATEIDSRTSVDSKLKSTVSDYGNFTIANVVSNLPMQVSGDELYNQKYDNSAKTEQFFTAASGNLWQEWQVIYKTTVNNVKYYAIMNHHSGKVLDVPGSATTNDLQLQQYQYNGSNAQLWELRTVGSYYYIINKGNGLAVTNLNGSTSAAGAIVQETFSSSTKQQWLFTAVAADTYRDDEVTRYFQRDNTSLGSVAWDQGNTIPLTWSSNNGKVLWVTQDAWDGSRLQSNMKFNCSDYFNYNNSIIIQQSKTDWTPDDPNMTISSPMGRPKQICSNQSGTDWSWPAVGVEINDKVYMQCGEGTGLNATNQSLYVLTQSTGTLWTSQRTTPAGMSGQVRINYSVGMIKGIDGYVYVYGAEGTSFGYASNIYIARFPQSDPQSWTFWNGSSWVTDINASAVIATSNANTSIVYCDGKYVLATMDCAFNCDATRNIYTATATNITGPFSSKTQVYKLNDYFYGQYTRAYTLIAHPEFDNGHSELLITYAVNYSACGLDACQGGWIDPNYYRIRALRIPYSKMGM